MVGVALDSKGTVQSRDRLRRTVLNILTVYWAYCLVSAALSLVLFHWIISPHISTEMGGQFFIVYRVLTALNMAAYGILVYVTAHAFSRPIRWEWQILTAVLVFLVLTGAPFVLASVYAAMDGNGWQSVVLAVLKPLVLLTQILFLRWSRL